MNHSRLIPLHLVLILSTAIIITARPNILQYERIRKYRYSVGEGSKSSQEPLIHSSATYKTTTSLSTTTTITDGNEHHNQERLYTSLGSVSSINHISYDDFINLTCQEEEEHEENHGPSSSTTNRCYLQDDESSSNTSKSHNNYDIHTNTNKLHRTFLRIPSSIGASKVILESEEFNEDHLFESYIYS